MLHSVNLFPSEWERKAEVYNDKVPEAWLKSFWHFFVARASHNDHATSEEKIITYPWPLLPTSDKRLISPAFNSNRTEQDPGPPLGNNYTPILR